MSALAAALHDAGYADPKVRLRAVVADALKASPRNWDGAKDAVYKAVRDDAGLLWELFAPYRSQAVQVLLAEVGAELRQLEVPRAAVVPSAPGHRSNANQNGNARRAAMDAVAAVARRSLLDTFKINGQSIGDVTAAEANRWAASQKRNVRFVQLLAANLPEDAPIRKFRTAEEATAIYEQASRENGDV